MTKKLAAAVSELEEIHEQLERLDVNIDRPQRAGIVGDIDINAIEKNREVKKKEQEDAQKKAQLE